VREGNFFDGLWGLTLECNKVSDCCWKIGVISADYMGFAGLPMMSIATQILALRKNMLSFQPFTDR